MNHWFKNKWYDNNKAWIYENLRGSIVHQYRPGKEILLTSICKNNCDPSLHLRKDSGKTIFILESLFEDFKLACLKVEREMSKKYSPYKGSKMLEKYMSIYEIESWDKSRVVLSGNTETIITKELD